MRNSLVIGKTDNGYTIFKNMDEDMVREIKEFQVPVTIFSNSRYKNATIVQKLNDTQNLCIDEKQEYFVETNKGIQDSLKSTKLNAINTNFNVVKAIEKTFGTLYSYGGYCKYIFEKNHRSGYNDLNSIGYSEIGIELSTYGGISVTEKTGKWSSFMFCFLNEDGNIENRDYNLDIEKLLDNKPKTKDGLIQEIISHIPDVPYKNYANKWFSKDFVFILTTDEEDYRSKELKPFSLIKLYKSSGDNYGSSRNRVKMPAKAVEVTRDHLLHTILPIINEISFDEKADIYKYLNVESKIEPEAIVPIKRVQTTIINENEYFVYDFTEDEQDFDDDKVITALKNIDQSIDIPNNVSIVLEFVESYLYKSDLPSYSFSKGEAQEDHSDFKGYVKMPYGCNFTFCVCEGDADEITWSHSIYSTEITDLEFVD